MNFKYKVITDKWRFTFDAQYDLEGIIEDAVDVEDAHMIVEDMLAFSTDHEVAECNISIYEEENGEWWDVLFNGKAI